MRILTGIQPSGIPHIGNYFGMLHPTVELQKEGEVFVFIADYHSLTTSPEPKDLRERVKNVALDILACGLDPEKTVFYRQSDMPQVCEFTWILSCLTTVGLLERAHSYKDKLAKGFTPNNGLLSYPVLMAADILLYNANIVPVGKDQKQHLEITRDIAIRFNNIYGDILTIPEEKIKESLALVPGTDGQKMSKSYNNTIPICGAQKAIRKTVMNIVTDCKGLEEPKDPENCNVVNLFKLFASESEVDAMAEKYRAGNYGYGHAKQELFEKMWEYFTPFRERREEFAANPDYVESILLKGKEKATAIAEETMAKVRKAVGLR